MKNVYKLLILIFLFALIIVAINYAFLHNNLNNIVNDNNSNKNVNNNDQSGNNSSKNNESKEPINNIQLVYVDDDSIANYSFIQDAIDNVTAGSTIIVRNGFYYENLFLNKTINLIGENNEKTIIFNTITNETNANSIIYITANYCNVSGFNIININFSKHIAGFKLDSSYNNISNNVVNNSYTGISLGSGSSNNIIYSNIIINSREGISTFNSGYNNFTNNNISNSSKYGIYIGGYTSNTVFNNYLSNNEYGIRIKGSTRNNVVKNIFVNNDYGTLVCCGSNENILYLNIYKNNAIYNARDEGINSWDNGSIGNYWDDYEDEYPNAKQIDGIWDTQYIIKYIGNLDRYPLVNPI